MKRIYCFVWCIKTIKFSDCQKFFICINGEMRHSGCTETPELIFNPERLVCDRWEAHLQPGEAHLRQVRSSSLCSWHKHEFRLVLVSSTNFVWFLKQERISFLFRLFLDTRMNFVFVLFDSRHKNEFWFCFVCFLIQERI